MSDFGQRPEDVVTDTRGNVQPGITLTFYASQSDATSQTSPLGSATTDSNGRWTFTDAASLVYVRTPAGDIYPCASETGAASVSDATASTKGIVQLAGDLGGSAAAPTVPGLAGKAATSHTHTHTDVTDFDTAVGNKVDVATLNNAFGQTGGQPISPWQKSTVHKGELWATANFVTGYTDTNTAVTTLTSTCNGTEHRVRNVAWCDYASSPAYVNGSSLRVEFDYDASTVTSGWWEITLAQKKSGDNLATGTVKQTVMSSNGTNPTSGHFVFDFSKKSDCTQFEISIYVWNNAPSGTITVNNISLRRTGAETRPMLFTGKGDPSANYATQVMRPVKDVNTNAWWMSGEAFGRTDIATDYGHLIGYSDPHPWNTTTYPDPDFTHTYVQTAQIGANSSLMSSSVSAAFLRITNNDQIIVMKPIAGANAGVWEFRGNVHGGETDRAGITRYIDQGSGTWASVNSLGNLNNLTPCRRFKLVWPSALQGSTDTTAFANVDHTFTAFPDGMTRCDRTTTFLRATDVREVYEWMSSYDDTKPRIGRIGRGLTVIANADSFAKVAVPAAPTVTTATTGGTLAAATYSYRVAALSSEGETTPSSAGTVTTTGSTSTATVTWSTVANATGYRIYGRTGGTERLLATVAPSTSWVDTGANVPLGQPQTYNNASILGSTQSDTEDSDAATWAVWYDPTTGWAHGNIYDREAVLGRSASGVDGSFVRLEKSSGIQKQYNFLTWSGTTHSITVPSGTAWTATHWSFVYRPADPANFHAEIAVRAASLAALASVYPST